MTNSDNQNIKCWKKLRNRGYFLFLISFTLSILFICVGLGLIFGNFGIATSFVTQTPIFNPPISNASLSDSRVLELINKEREKENLKSLGKDAGLSFVAYIRAKNIMANGDFSHEATKSAGLIYSSVADRLLISYKKIGENLAMGDFNGEETTLVRAWMESPKHRKVILGDCNKVGIYILLGKFNSIQTEVIVLIAVKD